MQDLDYEVIRSVNSLDTLEKDGDGLDDLPRTLNYTIEKPYLVVLVVHWYAKWKRSIWGQ